ncbi:MAG: hypothetical protein RIQ81_353 [Pseudomonadota bacterium]
MTGNSQFLMQSVATVLPFAPPGLLLVATFLQLRRSPVSRLLSIIRSERLHLLQVAGSGSREAGHPKSQTAEEFYAAIKEARRSGQDLVPRLEMLEDNLEKLRDEEQELADAFKGLWARTGMALCFTLILVMTMKASGATHESNTAQTAATGTACASLMLAGVLLPLGNLQRARKELDVLAPPAGTALTRWVLTGRFKGEDKDPLTRSGISDSIAVVREGDQLFRELRSRSRNALSKASRMTSVYEVLTLAPSSALLVAGNWC